MISKTLALATRHRTIQSHVGAAMTGTKIIEQKLVALKAMADAGYAIALHVEFTAPSLLFQTYDRKWLDYYSQNGLVMSDPTVHWGFENRGHVSWSALKANDPQDVLSQAAKFGLNHGVTCSVGEEAQPSIGSFARSDRPFETAEAEELVASLQELHELTNNIKELSPETSDALRRLAIEYTHPPTA